MGTFALFPILYHLIGRVSFAGFEVLTFTTAAAQLIYVALHVARVQKRVSHPAMEQDACPLWFKMLHSTSPCYHRGRRVSCHPSQAKRYAHHSGRGGSQLKHSSWVCRKSYLGWAVTCFIGGKQSANLREFSRCTLDPGK